MCRWSDLDFEFGNLTPVLSKRFHKNLKLFYDQYCLLVEFFQSSFLETKSSLYAEAIRNFGVDLKYLLGFIDANEIYIAVQENHYTVQHKVAKSVGTH